MRLKVGESQTCRKHEWTPALATEVISGRKGDALSRMTGSFSSYLISSDTNN